MDVYKTEEEQAEAIKKWWKENGGAIIAGVVIGLGAIFGWRAYNTHTIQQAEAASTLYEQMLLASHEEDAENIKVYANRVIEEHGSSTYAFFATLMLAKLAAEDNQLDQAETHLRWTLNNSPSDEFKHVARLRLARVMIAGDKLDKAQHLLNVSETGKFVAQYEELRGDIYAKQGKTEQAQQAYEKALVNSSNEAQSLIQMKLDDLGRS